MFLYIDWDLQEDAMRSFSAIASIASLCVMLGIYLPAFSFDEIKPPSGSKDASCRYQNGTPEFCKVKVVSKISGKVQVWSPEGMQSAMTITYAGKCVERGCVLSGEDFGYPGRPPRYKAIDNSESRIRWKEMAGNKAIMEIRVLAQ